MIMDDDQINKYIIEAVQEVLDTLHSSYNCEGDKDRTWINEPMDDDVKHRREGYQLAIEDVELHLKELKSD